MNDNHQVETTTSELFISAERLQPGKRAEIKVTVFGDSQHDGHGWTRGQLELEEYKLYAAIMEEVGKEVKALIESVKPFSIHKGGF